MNPYQQYKNSLKSTEAEKLANHINAIDLEALKLSEYNVSYIKKMKPTLLYYFQMFDYAFQKLDFNDDISNQWIVDFGGGHGFLSLYLKLKGLNVIYCDFNPNSVETIQRISNKLGYGPDFYVTGSTKELVALIQQENLKVNYFISTDTIEHVYDLEEMFEDLRKINTKLQMVFTTASNPKNFIKAAALRRLMIKDEVEEFIPLRKQFIANNYPEFTEDELQFLAVNSRGLRFQDLEKFVAYYKLNQKLEPMKIDAYNCCEPEFGAWTERILPLEEYRNLGEQFDFELEIENGFYCEIDKLGSKQRIVKLINWCTLKLKQLGLITSPFITLKFTSK